MRIWFVVLMGVIGAAVGSFLCCQARRLRLKELGKKKLGARSVCMYCKKQLRWHENLPVISWVLQKGRCRYCGKKIGVAEILAEVLTGLACMAVAVPFDFESAGGIEWAIWVANLILVFSLVFLAIYDGLYGELPSLCLTFSVVCAIMVLILRTWSLFSVSQFDFGVLAGMVGSGVMLGGLYLTLYLMSGGKWVGDGDWILALAIGLALAKPFLALVALFIANFLASIVMAPQALKKGKKKIFFGPFLVAAFVITLALYDIIVI